MTELAADTGADNCFHCGLPLDGRCFPVELDGVPRSTCCRGCQGIAQTIIENGLDAYYRTRSAMPPVPETTAEALERLRVLDIPEVQRGFVRALDGAGTHYEAALLIEGVTCAACVWLIEQRLSAVAGVLGVSVNYSARRARVRWDSGETQLSAILAAINALGYTAHPYDSARSDDMLRRERRGLLWRLFVAGLAMMQVMMYAVPVYFADGTMDADIVQLMRIAGLVLTAPVAAWAATPFYEGAWRALKNAKLSMDVPITAGVLAGFAASAAATLSGTGDVYFDSVTMFVFLLLGTRYLELTARIRATAEQERLLKLVPATAERLDRFPDPQAYDNVAAASLQRGELVLVRPGATVPADGVVVDGTSATDDSLLTGESQSVWKAPGDRVIGGAVNKHSPLVIRVEAVGEQSVLGNILRLIDRAQSEKPRIAYAADRAARVFVAFVLALSAAAAAVWYTSDPSRALWIAIAILVVGCPCALSLATPVALTAATGSLYKAGVLITRQDAIEALAKATHFVFDKTGTLTSGVKALIGVVPLGSQARETCLELAAALEAMSEHPVGKAIVAAAAPSHRTRLERLRGIPGSGVEAFHDGIRVRIGTPAFVAELHGQAAPGELASMGEEASPVLLGDEQGWIALFTFAESVRPEAHRLVSELNARGITTCLLSGDCAVRVQRLARDLGIAVARGDVTPQGKVDFVKALQADGAVVAMIGDGVNDAPVLAQAQVSIAMGEGSALAQNCADIILTGRDLAPLATAAAVSRLTLRVVRQNLAWATLYNLLALPLAATGLVTPLSAAAGMSLSSIVVVANALRLVRSGTDPKPVSQDGSLHADRSGERVPGAIRPPSASIQA
jgi:Cu2+-exporting ATPase